MTSFDPAAVAAEAAWLRDHPEFYERPATLSEFLGEDYLNIEKGVRASIREALSEIMGEEISADNPTKYTKAMLTGGIGIGKELRHDEPVLTPKGWAPISSLSVGDKVIGSDGAPTSVTGVFPQGRKPLYRVAFNDGAVVVAGLDHQWAVRSPKEQARNAPWRTVTTADMLAEGVIANGKRRFHIPVMSAPAVFEGSDLDLPVPAYTIGALLGDGGLTQGTVHFSTNDQEILERIELESGIQAKHISGCDYRFTTRRGAPNPLLAAVKALGMTVRSEHKRIPARYMTASPQARMDLLRGLLDTDGWVQNDGHTTAFCSTSPQLVADLVELVQSLGGLARVKPKKTSGLDAYTVTIASPENPFFLSRKAVLWKPRTKYKIARMVAEITPVEDDEAYCISVSAKDRLYVTRDYIVTHNTTIASIVLPYLCHWVMCLKDPQDFFGLLPGSRIAFMQMSTSESQAREVLFGDIVARIKYSPWFRDGHSMDPTFKNQIRFENDIWILPGDSQETTFEGYNILGGILDEADSHKVTKEKDYAQIGYDAIQNRITSRFGDRGFLLVIGQMKKSEGFAAKIYKEYRADKEAYAQRMTIWESLGWDRFMLENPATGDLERDSFWYDAKKKSIVAPAAALLDPERFIEVPTAYRKEFDNNPEKALRDLAGIPPAVGDPFISLTHKIEEARERWKSRQGGLTTPVLLDGTFENWFKCSDPLRRVVHIDFAYSADGDALGLAMGHVREMVEIEGERKPYIVFDMLYRMKAMPGSEIMLADVRRLLYHLRDDLKFRIKRVTMDGFESQDTYQQLRKRRFETEKVSVDKQMLPYYDLRDALYEDRIEFPEYLVYLNRGDTTRVEIAYKELAELTDTGKKIDHPAMGSKDVADGMAGCVYTLMGDRSFRRGVSEMNGFAAKQESDSTGGASTWGTPSAGPFHPALGSLSGLGATPPPSLGTNPLAGPGWDGPVRAR